MNKDTEIRRLEKEIASKRDLVRERKMAEKNLVIRKVQEAYGI